MNQTIRNHAQKRGVKLWQIAEQLGMQDSNFSRKLRHELDSQETAKIMTIIDELAAEHEKDRDSNE